MATPATAERIGTPASNSASEPPQTEAIDDEPFDSMMSETMRIVYGNSSNGGRTPPSGRLERALGEIAMADFATRGAAHRADFTGRERREVVMQHEGARDFAAFLDGVEALRVLGGAERRGAERLRLAACEEGRTVRARQHPRA